jgi:hypothetical protein
MGRIKYPGKLTPAAQKDPVNRLIYFYLLFYIKASILPALPHIQHFWPHTKSSISIFPR